MNQKQGMSIMESLDQMQRVSWLRQPRFLRSNMREMILQRLAQASDETSRSQKLPVKPEGGSYWVIAIRSLQQEMPSL